MENIKIFNNFFFFWILFLNSQNLSACSSYLQNFEYLLLINCSLQHNTGCRSLLTVQSSIQNFFLIVVSNQFWQQKLLWVIFSIYHNLNHYFKLLFGISMHTYFSLSNSCAAQRINFLKNSSLHILIPVWTIINFWEFSNLHIYSILYVYLILG